MNLVNATVCSSILFSPHLIWLLGILLEFEHIQWFRIQLKRILIALLAVAPLLIIVAHPIIILVTMGRAARLIITLLQTATTLHITPAIVECFASLKDLISDRCLLC